MNRYPLDVAAAMSAPLSPICRIAGNSFTVGPNGMAVHRQGPDYIDSLVPGTGRIVI